MKLIEFKDLPIGSLFTLSACSFSPSIMVFQKLSTNFAEPINCGSFLLFHQRSQMFGWNETVYEIDDKYISALQDYMAKIRREVAVLDRIEDLYFSKNLEHN